MRSIGTMGGISRFSTTKRSIAARTDSASYFCPSSYSRLCATCALYKYEAAGRRTASRRPNGLSSHPLVTWVGLCLYVSDRGWPTPSCSGRGHRLAQPTQLNSASLGQIDSEGAPPALGEAQT